MAQINAENICEHQRNLREIFFSCLLTHPVFISSSHYLRLKIFSSVYEY